MAASLPAKADDVPGVEALRELLQYPASVRLECATFWDKIVGHHKEYETAEGLRGTQLKEWTDPTHREGLDSMASAFLDLNGLEFWPNDDFSANYNELSHTADDKVLRALLAQLFWQLNMLNTEPHGSTQDTRPATNLQKSQGVVPKRTATLDISLNSDKSPRKSSGAAAVPGRKRKGGVTSPSAKGSATSPAKSVKRRKADVNPTEPSKPEDKPGESKGREVTQGQRWSDRERRPPERQGYHTGLAFAEKMTEYESQEPAMTTKGSSKQTQPSNPVTIDDEEEALLDTISHSARRRKGPPLAPPRAQVSSPKLLQAPTNSTMPPKSPDAKAHLLSPGTVSHQKAKDTGSTSSAQPTASPSPASMPLTPPRNTGNVLQERETAKVVLNKDHFLPTAALRSQIQSEDGWANATLRPSPLAGSEVLQAHISLLPTSPSHAQNIAPRPIPHQEKLEQPKGRHEVDVLASPAVKCTFKLIHARHPRTRLEIWVPKGKFLAKSLSQLEKELPVGFASDSLGLRFTLEGPDDLFDEHGVLKGRDDQFEYMKTEFGRSVFMSKEKCGKEGVIAVTVTIEGLREGDMAGPNPEYYMQF